MVQRNKLDVGDRISFNADQNHESVVDRLGGRSVSRFDRELPPSRTQSQDGNDSLDSFVSELRAEAESKMADKFIEIFSSMVVLPSSNATQFKNLDSLAFAFDQDWQKLRQVRQDWEKLIASLVRVETKNTDPRRTDTGLGDSANVWKSQILEIITWPSGLNFKGGLHLDRLSLEQAFEALVAELAVAITTMSSTMVNHLKMLQDKSVCGVIEWTGRNECRFSYCTREIESKVSYFGDAELVDEWREAVEGDVDSLDSWVHEVWLETAVGSRNKQITIHVHDLTHAVICNPYGSSVEIPAAQKIVIDAIPTWLTRHVTIVEGKLVRERRLCRDVGQETWESTRLVSRTWLDMVPPRPLFDPAIVLGDTFVLDGWKLLENVEPTSTPALVSLAKKIGEILS